MEKPISNKDVYYLLIGAFSLFFLIEISYSIGYITKTLLIMSNQNSLLTFILKEGLEVFTFLLIAILGFKHLLRSNFSTNRLRSITISLIICCIITQVIEVALTVFMDYNGEQLDYLTNYTTYLNGHYELYIIESIMFYFKLIIFALILFNYLRVNDFKTQS
ncbi:MAG: hypothetical protein CMC05_13640 [Flavobacteriaceae bacterium]|nr:hypothetical protein [Flavobacteriaceae bacterium]|tara:strand:- start:1486 stop:1971 length:486 start_codon:yes stop_codon:yes gene_type:complete